MKVAELLLNRSFSSLYFPCIASSLDKVMHTSVWCEREDDDKVTFTLTMNLIHYKLWSQFNTLSLVGWIQIGLHFLLV
ncbi:unnamed protein product [Lathyrus oleraceus]